MTDVWLRSLVSIGLLASDPANISGLRQHTPAALYESDGRRLMTGDDYRRFAGAGILFCRDTDGISQRAAASWLIGTQTLVMMNAHNFRNRRAEVTRALDDCFFQIDGKNYDFDPGSLELGIPLDATDLHITDDWALARLRQPVDSSVEPQSIPKPTFLPTGDVTLKVVMVSPAGHANFRGQSSIEQCTIRRIDPPSEDAIRRARHDCNDGYGGSGSGLFDEAGHLLAMQSASLDMNRKLPFDVGLHYGSALLIEGKLLDALTSSAGGR